jgi:hypothetical protein
MIQAIWRYLSVRFPWLKRRLCREKTIKIYSLTGGSIFDGLARLYAGFSVLSRMQEKHKPGGEMIWGGKEQTNRRDEVIRVGDTMAMLGTREQEETLEKLVDQ